MRGLRRVSQWFLLILLNSVNSVRVHRVWPILTEFASFRVFYLISHSICVLTRKIVWFYESTHEFDNHGHNNPTESHVIDFNMNTHKHLQFQHTIGHNNPVETHVTDFNMNTCILANFSARANPFSCFVHSIHSYFFVKCSGFGPIVSLFPCSPSWFRFPS